MTIVSPPIARTPLHAWHQAQGARFTGDNDWQVPAVYTSVERETAAARTGVALADISAFAKFSLLGPGMDEFSRALTGAAMPLKPRSTARIDLSGPVLACRLTSNHLLVLTSRTGGAELGHRLARLSKDTAIVLTDVSSTYAGMSLVGPRTGEVLRQVTSLDVSPTGFPDGSCAETNLAGIQALLIRPSGAALPSMRIYVSWDLAEHAWEELLKAGRSRGLTATGLEGWATAMT